MLGKKSGVAKQIRTLQPKALETHCHGHSLNLAVKGTTQECKLLRYLGHIKSYISYFSIRFYE